MTTSIYGKYEFKELIFSVDDGVASIRLNRPNQLNAFSSNLYGEVRLAARLVEHSPEIELAVVSGAGRAFGTGGDLREVLGCYDEDNPEMELYRFENNWPFEAIRQSSKVFIASIDGACLAGGCILASSCDLLFCSSRSIFGIPEGKAGFGDGWGPAVLMDRIGRTHVQEMVFTGASFDAEHAYRIGLVNDVVDAAELDDRVAKAISDCRATSVQARRLYKRHLYRMAAKADVLDLSRDLHTDDVRERLQAFASRGERSRT